MRHCVMLNAEETLHAAEMLFKEGIYVMLLIAHIIRFLYHKPCSMKKTCVTANMEQCMGVCTLYQNKVFDEIPQIADRSILSPHVGRLRRVTVQLQAEVTQILEQAWDFLKTAKIILPAKRNQSFY